MVLGSSQMGVIFAFVIFIPRLKLRDFYLGASGVVVCYYYEHVSFLMQVNVIIIVIRAKQSLVEVDDEGPGHRCDRGHYRPREMKQIRKEHVGITFPSLATLSL
jgi:hypothetical protein